MLRGLLLVIELVLIGLIAYNLVIAAAGWRNPPLPDVRGVRQRRFLILIPAHNEERVVARLVTDLSGQLLPGDELWALADRCTDDTAARARAAGALVAERTEGPDGKGAVLRWFLQSHPLPADKALVVVDADNRVPSELLTRFAAELDDGHHVLQAYLDVSNPGDSAIATASALSYWASNRMVQLARTNLGWPADLGGTGMCLDAGALADSGGFGDSLVEDQELGVRCFLSGYSVRWLHDLRIADEKPATASVSIRQRSRWATGRRQVANRWWRRLLSSPRRGAKDLALRLVQPSRIAVALLSALLAVGSALGLPLFPWQVWAGIALVQFLAPIAFLARDKVPLRFLGKYPLLIILPLLKLAARFRRNVGWYHTPHGLADLGPDRPGGAD
jgi:cellulose synthase/poly-beta-1,6-N-acetylglucosamine synthase-like glycosyltransferase